MYIEFKLPPAVAGMALKYIRQELETWAQRYHVSYTQKTIKNTHRVGFNDTENFSLFSMTWNPDQDPLLAFQIVNIENQRY